MKANQYFIFDSDSLKFNMNMSGTTFARSRLQQYLKEAGILAKKNQSGSWEYRQYYFEETIQIKDNIYISGNAFDGICFYEILKSSDKEKIKTALECVISASLEAIDKGISLPLCGPVCTLLQKDNNALLFLPMELCSRSLIASGRFEESSYLGQWINKGLNFEEGHKFLLSNYIYFYITKRNAFPQRDEEIRTEDYYDCNFVPLELTEECTNYNFGKQITYNLSKGSPKGRKALEAMIIPSLDSYNEESTLQLTDKEKSELRKIHEARKEKKLSFVRKYRKNIMSIKTAAYIAGTILILTFVYFIGKSPAPDTLGLTSRQVTECAFTGVNRLDIQLFMECMKGNTGKNFQEIIAGFYTSGKMRANYEREAGTLPPNQWFYVYNKKGYNYWSFGITNFTLNGIEADSDASYYKHGKKEKVKAIKEENGRLLKKGDIASYTAHYYMLHHETLDKLYVDEHTSELELTYNGKKFYVTSFKDSFIPVEFSTYDFNKEFSELLSQNKTISKCCEILKEKYPWVPCEKEIIRGQEEIRKFFLDKYMIKYDE